MAILGKVAGSMLKDNLVRNGVDLILDTNLMYWDVANRRVGINTTSPGNTFVANGNATLSNIYFNNTSMLSLGGNLILNAINGNIDVSTLRIGNVANAVYDQDVTTKSYVDQQILTVSYPNLYIGNGIANTNVVLSSETLDLLGTANQIDIAVTSNNQLTFSMPNDVTILGNLNADNVNANSAYIQSNLYVFGNVITPEGSFFGNNGVFFGDPVTGNSALYAGTPGYTILPNVVVQVSGNLNSYSQINFENQNSGASASTDYVATADDGTDSSYYIDLGINSSGYNDPHFTIGKAHDGYLYVVGSSSDGPAGLNQGNLVLGSTNGVVRTFVGNTIIENSITTVNENGLIVDTTTLSNSKTTGALIINGGVGIEGNIYAGSIQDTAIGNATASTGRFTTLTATSGYNGSVNGSMNGTVGATTPNSGAFTTITASSTANITGNVGVGNLIANGVGGQVQGYLTGAIGANVANSGAFTTINVSSTITASSTVDVTGTIYAQNGLQGNTNGRHNGVVGDITPNTGAFTNVDTISANIGNLYLENNSIYANNTDGNVNIIPAGNGIINLDTVKAVQLPSGSNLNRPDVPERGMFRFNTNTNTVEYWDGTQWTSLGGTATTTVLSDQFFGTGSQLVFNLTQNSTTSGTLVTINGVAQTPDVNYSVSGNVLSFTEAPISTDLIEARTLVTTSTTTGLYYGNSNIQFDSPANLYAILATVDSNLKLSIGDANTHILNTLVVDNNIIWANGNPFTSPPGGFTSSLQFNDDQAFEGAGKLIYDKITGNLFSNASTESTSKTTGAVVIGNGLGVGGNVFANAYYSDYYLYSNGAPITTPAGGYSSALQFNDSTNFAGATYLQYDKNTGNLVSNSTATSTSTTTGAIVVGGGVGIGGNLNVGGKSNTFAGNLLPSANVTYSLGSTSNRWSNLWLSGTTIYLGSIALKDNNGSFSVYDSTGQNPVNLTTASINNTPVGNATASTGAFTTLSSTGATVLNGTTESTGTYSGILVVHGGVGIAKNAYIGGNVVITGNLQVVGVTTTTASATLNVSALTVIVANGATNSSQANNAGLQVNGANANLLYNSTSNNWVFDRGLTASQFNGPVAGPINGTVGATTPNTGAFTTLTATTGYQGSVNGAHNGTVGATTPNTGAFSNVTINGTANLNTMTASTIAASVIGNTGTILIGTLSSASLGSLGNTQVYSLGVGTTPTNTQGEIRATNNITAYYSSDRSLKTNIRNIENALFKVNSINGVYFDWTDEYINAHGGEDPYFMRKSDVGVIAQEIESVLPEVVATRNDGTKAVKYEKIVALLIQAVKELELRIEELEKK